MTTKTKKFDLNSAKALVNRVKYSNKPLYKAILKALPAVNDDQEVLSLYRKFDDISNKMNTSARRWSGVVFWLYTVCNPRIDDQNNIRYSPVYAQHSSINYPDDQFNELSHMDDRGDGRPPVKHQAKLIADERFNNLLGSYSSASNSFGSAWDNDGNVIKVDDLGHPILDNFAGYVANKVTDLQSQFINKKHLDAHFQAFYVAHTRDTQVAAADSEVEHRPAHIHLVLALPNKKSRFQIINSMGAQLDDFTATFQWLAQQSFNNGNDRINEFLDQILSLIDHFRPIENYQEALQYLVHQSPSAIKDQKTPYQVSEVISWLPNDPATVTYADLAGVYDNDAVASGKNADIIRILHNPYNRSQHTIDNVSSKQGHGIVTYAELTELHLLGKKQPGRQSFSQVSRKSILDYLLNMIRSNESSVQVGDWQMVLYAAFDTPDADSLIADRDFKNQMQSIIDAYRDAMSKRTRDMQTIVITSKSGGMGKTRLARALSRYYDQGREPCQTTVKDVDKTFDPYQEYHDETSIIIDEFRPVTSLESLFDTLDPHKIPHVSSRNTNKIPWAVKHTFLTKALPHGISEMVRDILHYSPGIMSYGYLAPVEASSSEFNLKENDVTAGDQYLSQLSQLLRRLPVDVRLNKTVNGKAIRITVSILNINPNGQLTNRYDYVHTSDSDFIIHKLIDSNLSDKTMQKIAHRVAKAIDRLQAAAKAIFDKNPNAILNDYAGFKSSNTDFGLVTNGAQTTLLNDYQNQFDTFNDGSLFDFVSRAQFRLRDNVDQVVNNIDVNANQLDALLAGKSVPYQVENYDTYATLQLTDLGMQSVHAGRYSRVITKMVGTDYGSSLSITSSGLFRIQHTKLVAEFSN